MGLVRHGDLAFIVCVALISSTAQSEATAAEGEQKASYHAALGPGIYVAPTFPGARSSRQVLFPFLDAEYDDRWYTSASDIIGLYGVKTASTQAGAAIAWDLTERLARDDWRLRNLPDVRETARLKLFASHTIAMFTADANIATDLLEHGQGTLGQVNLWITIPFHPALSLSIGPGLTWADEKYVNTFYTVTPNEAERSGLPAFSARAGVADLHFNAFADWKISSNYETGVSFAATALRNDVNRSPITVQTKQSILMGWVAYRFH
jgi:outer membrane scaffolding protein for murein synthesis (MipA/OmpV family)